jgi:CcmD family protein
MGALVAAYVAAWLGVSLYVIRLGIKQSQLGARLDALTSHREKRVETAGPFADAA